MSRLQDVERLADGERDLSGLITCVLRDDAAGFDAVMGNADWFAVAEVGATWIARIIIMLCGDGGMCIDCTRRELLGKLRLLAEDEPPPGPDAKTGTTD